MILENANVLLRKITESDIEMVRCWRNDVKISQYMSFRDYITPEMQQQWFEKINNKYNYFFIINIDNKDIGMTELKNIDYEKNIAEAGIFIYDDLYLNGIYSYIATYILFDFGFNNLGLKTIVSHVLENNKRAIKFNKSLGFSPSRELIGMSRKYILNEKSFLKTKLTLEIVINNSYKEQ